MQRVGGGGAKRLQTGRNVHSAYLLSTQEGESSWAGPSHLNGIETENNFISGSPLHTA